MSATSFFREFGAKVGSQGGDDRERTEEEERARKAYARMRKLVGALGFLVPVVLVGGGLVACGIEPQESISAYYHTALRDEFVGMLFAVGFFLIGYGAYSRVDDRLSTTGGVAALGVALFPVDDSSLHYWFATAQFLILTLFCFFLFPRGDLAKPGKRGRNRIYRVCGVVMLSSLGVIAAYSVCRNALGACTAEDWLARLKPTLIFETLALWAFGVSWVVKGTEGIASKFLG